LIERFAPAAARLPQNDARTTAPFRKLPYISSRGSIRLAIPRGHCQICRFKLANGSSFE
jgi:hypothetical protein